MSGDQTLEHSCAHSIIHSIPLSFNCKQKPFHQLTLSSPSNSSQGHQKPPWTRGFMWIFWDWGRPSRRGSFHSHINFWLCGSIWNGNKNDFYPSVADLFWALHKPEFILLPDLAIGRFRGRRFVLYSFILQKLGREVCLDGVALFSSIEKTSNTLKVLNFRLHMISFSKQ